jgi:hypothetical protein
MQLKQRIKIENDSTSIYKATKIMFATKSSHMCDVMEEELQSSIQHMRNVVCQILHLSYTNNKEELQTYCITNESTIKQILAYCNQDTMKQKTFKLLVEPYI